MAICGSAETGHQIDYLFKFSFFFTCMGDPPRGAANVRNFKLLVRTVHYLIPTIPARMKGLPCLL